MAKMTGDIGNISTACSLKAKSNNRLVAKQLRLRK